MATTFPVSLSGTDAGKGVIRLVSGFEVQHHVAKELVAVVSNATLEVARSLVTDVDYGAFLVAVCLVFSELVPPVVRNKLHARYPPSRADREQAAFAKARIAAILLHHRISLPLAN